MKFNLKLISLILILFFISVSAVCAEDSAQTDENTVLESNIDDNVVIESDTADNIDETQTNDVYTATGTGNSTAEPKGFHELQEQIWAAKKGDTIELDCDYVSDGVREWDIGINKQLTIDGKGHTLDGKNAQGIFTVSSGVTNVVIKNVNFINGVRNCGAAIHAYSGANYLTVDNCTFKNNKATTDNVGGAIVITANNCKVTNCYFENNVARTSGGAIRLEGDSNTISNNIFKGNKATNAIGGAINALGHKNKITGNTFTKNVAARDGGAICIEGTKLEDMGIKNVISNNVFDSNKVTGSSEGCHGGAISMAGENCEISNNNFTNNHADDIGGAIRWNGADGTMGKITGNNFKTNTAPSGGAIYISGHGITISKNTFDSSNAATQVGGSINIHGNNAVISENTIKNSKSNGIAGAIYVEGKNTQIKNNDLTKCTSGDNGGGAYLAGSGSVIGNTFTSCSATNNGGGIYFKSTDYTLTSNTFKSNSAKNGANYYPKNMPSGKISTKLTATDVTATYGTTSYIIAALTDANGNPIKGAKIGFANNGVTYVNTDSSGKARYYTTEFLPGTYKIDVKYYGNDTYEESDKATSKVTINKIATKLTVTSTTAQYKSNSYIIATLKDANGNPIKGAKIGFANNGVKYATTDSNGKARYYTNELKEGTYDIKAKFYGNATHAESNQATSKVVIISNKIATKLTVTSVSTTYNSGKYIIATLTDTNGNPIQGAKIGFANNGVKYVTTDSAGKARYYLNGLKEGSYNIKVAYYGDDTHKASNQATSKVVISKIATKLTVTSVSTTYNSGMYIIATLTDTNGNPIQGAKIGFANNGVKYVTTDSAGKARYYLNGLKEGSYNIKVAYYGDDTYKASNQATSKVVISKIATKLTVTSLTAKQKSKSYIIARLTDSNGNAISGVKIGFANNGVKYVTTDANGKARLYTSDFAVGTYNILAAFFGTDTYQASNKVTSKVTITK